MCSVSDKALRVILSLVIAGMIVALTSCASIPFATLSDEDIANRIVGGIKAGELEPYARTGLNMVSESLNGDQISIPALATDLSNALLVLGRKKESKAVYRIGGVLQAAGVPDIVLLGDYERVRRILVLVKRKLGVNEVPEVTVY